MARYTVQELTRAAYAAGFRGPDLLTAVAVSLAENPSRDSNATNTHNRDGSIDRGAWQINSVHHFPGNPYDLNENAREAYSVWKSQGWAAWTQYRNKGYVKKLPQAQHAAATTVVSTTTGFGSVGGFIDANKALAGGVAGAAGNVIDSTTAIPRLAAHLLSPEFWRMVGIGALAVLLLTAGFVLVVESNKTVRSATLEAGKAAAIA